ncbi:DUF3830 family protein [Rhodospira trueperi]|uniref:Uncharacterized protein n=1 Tax=Rhodospira trueperi TaxID=69960 RepID=A0A1G7B0H3_9PROT|nr:DUF3830 family protein [Rhodospira trueperi]SDE20347.1 Protein of unknown function [Rhodospira trueperi]
MPDQLIFRCEGTDHAVTLTDEAAPRTLAALKAWLPADITLHCAKIAGCHIYWPTPILEPLEQGADIHSLPPGAFLYYPDRQYMELTYDALQAETASVNLLGHIVGDVGWLRDLADVQRREHGRRTFSARLFLSGQDEAAAPAGASPVADSGPLGRLREGRRRVWAGEPAEVEALMRRDGLNIPFGPLVTAEGEFRRTQELMWRLWRNATGHDDRTRATIACETLDLTLDRIVGYCHLHESGEVLRAGREALTRTDDSPVGETLADLTIFCGRMAAWLDLRIPWWDANGIVLRHRAGGPSKP